LTQDGEDATMISREFADRANIFGRVANTAIDQEVEIDLTQYDGIPTEQLDEKFGSEALYSQAEYSYNPVSRKVRIRAYKY
jgi:hypothetical protein